MKRKRRAYLLPLVGILIVVIYLFPVIWMILTSFKSQSEIFATPPTFLPKNFNLSGYQAILEGGILLNLRNSFLIAFSAASIAILLAVPAGYSLAKYRFWGRVFCLLVFLASQMLPSSVILTPLFILFSRLGILNTYLAPILATACAGIPFSVIMLRPFFASIPRELEEAATIDGSSQISTFFRIVVPLALPSIVVCFAISFFFSWGDLVYSMTFNRKQTLWPVTAGIYNAIGEYGIQWNTLMAYATFSALPVMIVFVLLQKRLVKGLTAGAIK